MITLGIIDKDTESRNTTRLVINSKNKSLISVSEVKILFEADCVNTLNTQQIASNPSHIILDISDREPRIINKVKALFPCTHIIVVNHLTDTKHVRECFRNGCVSYLLKSQIVEFLGFTLHTTSCGGSFISPNICRAIINQDYDHRLQENLLTARELQIARGIIDGLSYKLIADRHSISLDTVRVYIKRVYKKLKINSKGELFAQMTA